MKKHFLIAIFSFTLLITPAAVSAQSMMGKSTETISDGHTAREEAEGKEVWEKLQAKQLECKNLTDDNFETLGEYFMGQKLGVSHENMNNMMKQMMGEEGEKQMHISLGKQLSNCDASYPIPIQGTKFLPMMGMMGGGWNNIDGKGGGWPMMGNFSGNMMGGWGVLGLITWILIIIFLVLGTVYFGKEINRKDRK